MSERCVYLFVINDNKMIFVESLHYINTLSNCTSWWIVSSNNCIICIAFVCSSQYVYSYIWEVFQFNRFIFSFYFLMLLTSFNFTVIGIFCDCVCQTFCTAAFNNASLMHPLTGGCHWRACLSMCVCAEGKQILIQCCTITS